MGSQGSKGDTGAEGPRGPEGPKGSEGPKGPKGDTGGEGTCDPACTVSTHLTVGEKICIDDVCITKAQLSNLLALPTASNIVEYDKPFHFQSMTGCNQHESYVLNDCGNMQSFGSPLIMGKREISSDHTLDHTWKITK